MIIKTADTKTIKSFVNQLILPKSNSHKGQNGRVLVIGGSGLFHAASIWAAEIASHFVDIVHYSSTKENSQIFLSLKKKFRNGIVIAQKDLPEYVKEDDAILVGPGMTRLNNINSKSEILNPKFEDLIRIKDEGEYTYYLTKYLIDNFPDKKFVFDAGSLQMMKKDWLLKLKTSPILTPHQQEFERLFGLPIKQLDQKKKIDLVCKTAKKYRCTILLKAVDDIISDGQEIVVINGGNQGLTKGGTGDLLAGLTVSFFGKNDAVLSASAASILLKKSADNLYPSFRWWYNMAGLVDTIPQTLAKLIV